jgi:superfamily II DNA or RNA helicase
MLTAEMGCVDGDAIVHINRAKKGFSIKLSDLYFKFNGGFSTGGKGRRCSWDMSIPTYIRSLCNGELRLNKIKAVLAKGNKEVLEIMTESGKKIKVTPDHEVCVGLYEYREARTLRVGKEIYTNGQWLDKDGYVRVGGYKGKHSRYTTGGVYEHILVMEKTIGRSLELSESIHHINGIRHDNRPENLQLFDTHGGHQSMHGKCGGYKRLRHYFVPKIEKILSIEPVGCCNVYDIVCDDPYRNFVANEIVVHNCGKTLMAMQWLRSLHVPEDDLIVVCPVSLITHWYKELKQFAGIEAHRVEGSPKNRRLTLLRPGVHIVNYEYLTLNEEALKAASSKAVVIIDESHKLKHPNTKRSKTFHKYCKDRHAVLLLTGTPISQGAQDYYSQFRCINPELLGHSYTSFKHRYCIEEQIRGAPIGATRIIGYRNLDELTKLTAPYIYTLRKQDCLDLPAKVYETRYVDLSDEQMKKYRSLKNEMATVLSSGDEVTAANILTRLIRFSQITQGFLSSDTGTVERFKTNPKLSCLEDIIEALLPGEQFIVMGRFLEDIKQVSAKLTELGLTHNCISGEVPPAKRYEIVGMFKARKAQVLIGQIRVLGVGFNIETCKKMIFYSNEYSHVDRVQAEDRIHRATSVGDSCVYIDIVANNTVDEHITTALKNKKNTADMLTELRLHFCE